MSQFYDEIFEESLTRLEGKDVQKAVKAAKKIGINLELSGGKLTGRFMQDGVDLPTLKQLTHEGWTPRVSKDYAASKFDNLADWLTKGEMPKHGGTWVNEETNAMLRRGGKNWVVELQGGQKNLPSGFKQWGAYSFGQSPAEAVELFHEKVADARWADENPNAGKRPTGWGRKPPMSRPATPASPPPTAAGSGSPATLGQKLGDDLGRDAIDVAEEIERPATPVNPDTNAQSAAQAKPRRAKGPIPLPPKQQVQTNPWITAKDAPVPEFTTPTLSQTMDPQYKALSIDSPEGRALRQMRRGQQAGMYAKIPLRAVGNATQLGGNSATMNFLSGLAGGGAARGGRMGMALRGGGRLAILAGLGYAGKKLYDIFSSDEKPAGAEGSTGQQAAQITPDVAKSREAGSKAFLGGLTLNEKAKFNADSRKFLMGLQDSKVTQAIRGVASGENAGEFNKLIKDVVTGKRDAAELNNKLVMAMGTEAKQGKVTYLPNTYKLGGKEYMMGIDNTEGSPRLVRMAMDGTKVEFDPYKPQGQ